MEKDDQSKKFVCKYCNKKYPCGKSLGGHLRSHRIVNNSVDGYDDEKAKSPEVDERIEVNGQSQSAYLLRDKPKKTKKFSDSSSSSKQQLKICKECGKGFQSVKALCGHMACHSEKDKQKLVLDDSESDTELSGLRQLRRSKRMTDKDKALNVYAPSSSMANGGDSSVSEIDQEQEQEEVAWSLMMLSRDTRKWAGLNSITDMSDHSSSKSLSGDTRVTRKNGLNCFSSIGEIIGTKKLRSADFGNVEVEFSDDSDPEYFGDAMKNDETYSSDDVYLRNIGRKRPKIKYGSNFQDIDFQSRSSAPNGLMKQFKGTLGKNSNLDEKYEQVNKALKKYNTRRVAEDNAYGSEEMKSLHYLKKGSYSSNRKVNGNGTVESVKGSNSLETDPFAVQTPDSKLTKSCSSKIGRKKKVSSNAGKKSGSRRGKVHQCPFCFKVFRSGQALGGHKRIHFVNGSEDRTFVIKQEVPNLIEQEEMPNLLDLNLPAPVEEEVAEHPSFMPW